MATESRPRAVDLTGLICDWCERPVENNIVKVTINIARKRIYCSPGCELSDNTEAITSHIRMRQDAKKRLEVRDANN